MSEALELMVKKGKEYNPHIVVVWTTKIGAKEFSFKEDAEDEYNKIVQLHAEKVVLAKVVKAHGEG